MCLSHLLTGPRREVSVYISHVYHTRRRCTRKRCSLFDSGCSLCTEVARRVEEAAGGWLEARSLRDPEMQALLDKAKPGWKWEPTLVEVDGDGVRVYQGLRMRVRMVRGLGVRKAWDIIKSIYQANIQLQRVDEGRREFIAKTGSLLGGALLLNVFSREQGAVANLRKTIREGEIKVEYIEGEERDRLLEQAISEARTTKWLDMANSDDVSKSVALKIIRGNNVFLLGAVIPINIVRTRVKEWLMYMIVYHKYTTGVFMTIIGNREYDMVYINGAKLPKPSDFDSRLRKHLQNIEYAISMQPMLIEHERIQQQCPPDFMLDCWCANWDNHCLSVCAQCSLFAAACAFMVASCIYEPTPVNCGTMLAAICNRAANLCQSCASLQPCCKQTKCGCVQIVYP